MRSEHRAIMDAALARDANLACRLSEEHIDRTLHRLAHLPVEEIAAGFPGLPNRPALGSRGPARA